MEESEAFNMVKQIMEVFEPGAGAGQCKQSVELLEQYPDNPGTLLLLGGIYMRGIGGDPDLDKALFYLEKSRSLARDQSIGGMETVQSLIGLIYEKKGLLDKALICYSEAYPFDEGVSLKSFNEKHPTYAGDTIKKLQEENNSLKEEIKRLQEEINFAPGGLGYEEAKEHFESLQS